MKHLLRMTSRDYEIIRQHLMSDEREQFLFILCEKTKPNPDTFAYSVKEILIPDEKEMKTHKAAFVEPKKEFQLKAYEVAAKNGSTLIDVHSHPFQQTPSFSGTDHAEGRRNAEFLSKCKPRLDFSLIVFNSHATSYSGMIFNYSKNEFVPLERIEVLGSPSIIMHNHEAPKEQEKDAMYSRHHIIPGWKQHALPNLTVAIIGAGGIGAEVFQKLVCLGVGEGKGEIILIDDDIIEKSNLPRIPYATREDIGKPKVQVAARYATHKNPNIKTFIVNKKVQDKETLETLTSAQVIMGCVDSEAARKTITQISTEHDIPYIDAASEIIPEEKGYHAGGQVRTTIPGEGCLICYGGIDLSEAAQEETTEEIAEDYKKAGYIRGTNETPTPSVIHLNSTISSIAISQFIKLVFGENLKGQKAIFYDQQKMSLMTADFEKSENCPLCGEITKKKNQAKKPGKANEKQEREGNEKTKGKTGPQAHRTQQQEVPGEFHPSRHNK